eukprot:GHVQ01016103.1.p1 GENE.GHVQ01016103.1~~GHVQ01016103.1.p1  ORF type:complete len:118 (-),score=5.76 GHVQ01016103.1:102-404(-)
MAACLPCPAGYYCTPDGVITPTACPAGTYREGDATGETANSLNNDLLVFDEEAIYCKPCSQGSWSNETAVTSLNQCKACDARNACIRSNRRRRLQRRCML